MLPRPPTPGSVTTGRLFNWSVAMLWLNSPLSVLSSGLSASTVTASVAAPTWTWASMRVIRATSTTMPGRTNLRNPGRFTESSYVPAGNCASV